MKIITLFSMNISDYPFGERRAMREVIGSRLLDDLAQHYPKERGYEIRSETGDENREGWLNIYLAKGKDWRFRLTIEVDDRVGKKLFLISIGRDMDRNGLCILFGMAISLVGLSMLLPAGELFTGDSIAPLLFGLLIGGLILSMPIRPLIRPMVMAKAEKAGIEEAERRLAEQVNEVLEHAGLIF